ncbi:hypothetical protein [Pseudomonas fitomaticsae]|uniref:Uncharacterized protein n=1 Tax=Pseudomonas fitomaticsae TaxID=2837969 RepID=A0ABY3QBR8_9PSED|nr:hypothetical protein [Pseudomonas fitomaticsae]UFQ03045.1 hypothetical protein KJY40_11160 [Pseudomonas fitomaticsae]
MSEVTRYGHISYLVEATPQILQLYPSMMVYVMAADFDRVTAERDALQLRLNAADQRIDDLAAAAEAFAKVADLYAGEEDNSHQPARDVGMHDDLRLTLGQFRALSDLCTRPLMVGCKHGILCGDVTCECKGNGFIERRKVSQPITEQFIEDHLGKMPDQLRDHTKMIAERNPNPDFSLIGIVHTPPMEHNES